MIWFFNPYSFDGELFHAYDRYIQLAPDPEDWVCMTDGDALFFQSDFGHVIKDYIDAHPETGLFTGYASRIGNHRQVLSKKLMEVDSIKYHYKIADNQHKHCHGQVVDIGGVISGFLMIIQKKTWLLIRQWLEENCHELKQLKVDNEISRAILASGLTIRRMEGIYMLHYYRMVEGKKKRGIQ